MDKKIFTFFTLKNFGYLTCAAAIKRQIPLLKPILEITKTTIRQNTMKTERAAISRWRTTPVVFQLDFFTVPQGAETAEKTRLSW